MPLTQELTLTGVERFFDVDEIIVSKTDLKGRITYANRVFQRIAQYTEEELIGAQHNIVRHPDMPRCVFKFLWDTIQDGKEVFAYVINRCRSGDFYWVFAHVTPTFDDDDQIIGYHSSRRVPTPGALEQIKPIYRALLDVEKQHGTPVAQWQASLPVLVETLESTGMTYDEFIFHICG